MNNVAWFPGWCLLAQCILCSWSGIARSYAEERRFGVKVETMLDFSIVGVLYQRIELNVPPDMELMVELAPNSPQTSPGDKHIWRPALSGEVEPTKPVFHLLVRPTTAEEKRERGGDYRVFSIAGNPPHTFFNAVALDVDEADAKNAVFLERAISHPIGEELLLLSLGEFRATLTVRAAGSDPD